LNPTISRRRVFLAVAIVGMAVFLLLRLGKKEKPTEEKAQEAVRTVLNDQVAAWNEGDLEGFMNGYWQSDELTFFSGGDVQNGWQKTYDRYRRKYQGFRKELGLGPTHLVAQTLAAQALAPGGVPLGAAAQHAAALGVVGTDTFTPEMGTLRFEAIQIIPTGPKSAVVRGQWGLTFARRKPIGGLFTLLFREEAEGWRIVHDHTSG
jgi:beta-aspartyl-peptidase (threonine type)